MNLFQFLFNSILTGSTYILIAAGLTLTYGLLKFPNIAHGEYLTFGAYIAFMAESAGLNLVWGALLAFVSSGILSVISYLLFFRPLIRRGATSIHLTIASLAYSLALRYSFQQIWGRSSLSYRSWFQPFNIGPIRCTALWIANIVVAFMFIIVFHLMLTKTKIGKAMRAVSNNPILAMSCGISTEFVLLIAWFIGGALAGVGGVFRAADTRITPFLGWELLIPAFAVIILGGIGSFYGMFIASYLMGLVENFSIIALSFMNLSTEYRSLVAFIVIVILLTLRPQGLSGLRVPLRRGKND
ncbi:MAG: branched-chain amino acid ABC transporter permease [Thermoprotei archaeon]|nr:branched-chain amino acid ABC transporter permease [Thermoprotei archaeon]